MESRLRRTFTKTTSLSLLSLAIACYGFDLSQNSKSFLLQRGHLGTANISVLKVFDGTTIGFPTESNSQNRQNNACLYGLAKAGTKLHPKPKTTLENPPNPLQTPATSHFTIKCRQTKNLFKLTSKKTLLLKPWIFFQASDRGAFAISQVLLDGKEILLSSIRFTPQREESRGGFESRRLRRFLPSEAKPAVLQRCFV